MVNRPALVCSLDRFTVSFRCSLFLELVATQCSLLARVVDYLDGRQFFLLTRCCIAVFVDRPDVALMLTEMRLNLSEPMSSWTVPTPPLQVMAVAQQGGQAPDDLSISSGASIFDEEVWQRILNEA